MYGAGFAYCGIGGPVVAGCDVSGGGKAPGIEECSSPCDDGGTKAGISHSGIGAQLDGIADDVGGYVG